jgi:hypothetical protein
MHIGSQLQRESVVLEIAVTHCVWLRIKLLPFEIVAQGVSTTTNQSFDLLNACNVVIVVVVRARKI